MRWLQYTILGTVKNSVDLWGLFNLSRMYDPDVYGPPENFPVIIRASKITGNAFISINSEIIWSIFYHHSSTFLHTDVYLTRTKKIALTFQVTERVEDFLRMPKKEKGFPEHYLLPLLVIMGLEIDHCEHTHGLLTCKHLLARGR